MLNFLATGTWYIFRFVYLKSSNGIYLFLFTFFIIVKTLFKCVNVLADTLRILSKKINVIVTICLVLKARKVKNALPLDHVYTCIMWITFNFNGITIK